MATYKELLMMRDAHLVKVKIRDLLLIDPEVIDVEDDHGTGDLIVTFQPSDQPRKVRITTRAVDKEMQ